MKVAILGTGMAGLVAAHAVYTKDQSATIVLYGVNREPLPSGARWYEREIPGVNVMKRMVKTESAGDPKNYGVKLGGPVSEYFRARPDFLAFDYWDANMELWKGYGDNIIQLDPDFEMISESLWDDCDFVINTTPRPNFYETSEHGMFAATRHWRIDESGNTDEPTNPYRNILPGNQDKNLMIFDGTEDSSWFRITQVFGLMSVEWGFHQKPPIAGSYVEILPLTVPKEMDLKDTVPGWKGTKALAHVGAVARWKPSTDVGEVFGDVTRVLEGDFGDDDSRGRDS